MNDHEKKQATAIINKIRQDLQQHVDYYKTHYCDTDGEINGKNISLDSLARLDVIQDLIGVRPDADTEFTLKQVAKVSKNFNDELNNFKDELQRIHENVNSDFYKDKIQDNEIKQFYMETLKTARKEFNVFYKKYYNQLDVADAVWEKFYKKISASLIVDDVVNNLTKDMEE